MEVTGIRLFGMKISCQDSRDITKHPVIITTSAEESSDGSHLEEEELDGNPETHITETEGDTTEDDSLKKPNKILPCPRCKSMDTKFCYYNNYNIKQRRHFCKSCQRYWTAGGAMRIMPVGAGRRKHKNPTSNYLFQTLSQEALQSIKIEASAAPSVVSFGLNLPHGVVCSREKEDGDECSSGSTVTTSNSVVETRQDRNGFHPHVYCDQGLSWSYNPRNSSILIPMVYPSPYWNFIPWLPISSPTHNQKESINLGKHLRDGELVKINGYEEPKKHKSSVLIPKTLRIDDPEEAAKSSIWSTLGILNENISTRGMFKVLEEKGEESNKHKLSNASPVLQANPAAFSRSLCFQERA